jgi:pimeloyl-ACP methyl ester carboxylesterase
VSGQRIDRRRQALTVGVAAALVALAAIAGVVVHQVTKPDRGRPAVVQLPAPSASDTSPAAASVPPVTPAGSTLAWVPCGQGGAQCATLTVPMDWSHHDPAAAGRTVSLALIRYPATGPASQRIGSLLVNPGGPGASGVEYVRDGLSSIPDAIRQRFDIVGFDPRGTGSSDPVHCETGAQLDRLYALPPYPTTTAQTTTLDDASRQEALACKAKLGPLLPHLSTEDAARDLDAIRAALGEAKITYLGYSYGTYLGATYAQLFPTHIRAMVLDGAIDPSLSGTQALASQADGFEGAFDAFATWCAGNTQCAFGQTYRSSADLQAAYEKLAASVAAHSLSAPRPVTSGLFLEGTLVTLYSRSSWPLLGTALASAQSGSGALLLTLADQFLGRNADGSYDPEGEANLAVNCLDHTYPMTTAQANALATSLASSAPIFGRAIAWSGLGCAYWQAPVERTPGPIAATGSPPILVVGTTRDPATPYAQAQALARQLAAGSLLTYDGDGHTAYRATGSACVIGVVDAYLTSLAAPPRATGAHC